MAVACAPQSCLWGLPCIQETPSQATAPWLTTSPSPLQVPSYTNFFADALIAEAERDSRIIGIHAAMGGGTGMNRFEQRFPERTFDVGIAEQHAVTFAAGELPKYG